MLYQIGGLKLCIECEDAFTTSNLAWLWPTLFHATEVTNADPQHFRRLVFTASPPESPLVAVHLISRDNGVNLWRTVNGYSVALAASTLTLDTQHGEGSGYLNPDFWHQSLLKQRQFFLVVLIILLHDRTGYGLHANSLTWHEDSLLIVGHSGSGKTTLTLGLIHAGGRCLGDDALLLRAVDNNIQAHALRRGFACTAQVATQFPTLADALATAPVLSEHKKLLALETLWPDCFTPWCTPRLIIFPEVADTPQSRLIAMNPNQTLCALIQQSLGMLLDATKTRRQLALLKQLMQQTHSYRLLAGRDVYIEPERVAALLRAAIREG